jgi:hypothetical protein
LLGLGNKVKWYVPAAQDELHNPVVTQRVFLLAARYWRGSLVSFCPRTLQARLDCCPIDDQHALLDRVATRLTHKLPILNQRLDSQGVIMKEQGASSLSPEIYKRLEGHLADLEQALLAKDPMMPQHLRSSHALLISYPETLNLLDDSDVARLIEAAEIHTKTQIVKAAAAGKGGGASSRKKISIDDL